MVTIELADGSRLTVDKGEVDTTGGRLARALAEALFRVVDQGTVVPRRAPMQPAPASLASDDNVLDLVAWISEEDPLTLIDRTRSDLDDNANVDY